MNAYLVKTKEILQPATFNEGARITRKDLISVDGKLFVACHWTQNGKLVKVTSGPLSEVNAF